MDLVWLANQSSIINWTEFGIMRERPNFEAIPPRYHVYLILLYTFTATFALVGNLITLVVLKKGKRTSRNLSKYLINLSVSDLLMATFSIPFIYTSFMYGQWYFEPRFCPFVMSIQFYSVFVSVYTLVAIGIDRYLYISGNFNEHKNPKTNLNRTLHIPAQIYRDKDAHSLKDDR